MTVRQMVLLGVLALVVATGAWAGEKEGKGPKLITVSGQLTKVEAAAITVSRKKEGQDVESKIIAVDKDTKILIETDEKEVVPGEGGKVKEKAKVIEGTLADLKVGQRVTVACTEDGSEAVKIFVPRAAPPKQDKEGKEGGGAERPSKPRKPEGDREGGEGPKAPRVEKEG